MSPSAPPSEYLPKNKSVNRSSLPLVSPVITASKSAFAILPSPFQPSANPICLSFLPAHKPTSRTDLPCSRTDLPPSYKSTKPTCTRLLPPNKRAADTFCPRLSPPKQLNNKTGPPSCSDHLSISLPVNIKETSELPELSYFGSLRQLVFNLLGFPSSSFKEDPSSIGLPSPSQLVTQAPLVLPNQTIMGLDYSVEIQRQPLGNIARSKTFEVEAGIFNI